MRTLLFAAAAAFAASSVTAQQTPPPPCDGEVYRAFDFWAGEWDVTAPTGQAAGENSITIEENGCLLVERWKGARGSTGQSYNFVDRETGEWRQVWVSPGVTIDYSGGLDANGAMVLEGSIGYGAGAPGNGAKFRGTWTPQDDGSVKQHFQQYDAEKQEWTDWFIGIYTRKTAG